MRRGWNRGRGAIVLRRRRHRKRWPMQIPEHASSHGIRDFRSWTFNSEALVLAAIEKSFISFGEFRCFMGEVGDAILFCQKISIGGIEFRSVVRIIESVKDYEKRDLRLLVFE